jgi:hypothetical protein
MLVPFQGEVAKFTRHTERKGCNIHDAVDRFWTFLCSVVVDTMSKYISPWHLTVMLNLRADALAINSVQPTDWHQQIAAVFQLT